MVLNRLLRQFLPCAGLILFVIGCSGSIVENEPPPFYLLGYAPSSEANRIDLNTDIVVECSAPVDPQSVNSGSFQVSPLAKGSFRIVDNTIRLHLVRPLLYNTRYTVTLTTNLMDTKGAHLDREYSWSFTTRGHAPSIYRIEPPLARIDDTITIYGTHFMPNPDENRVRFQYVPAEIVAASETQLHVIVPHGAKSGFVHVSTIEGSTISPEQLSIVKPGRYWQQVSSGTDESLTSIAWSNYRFIAVGHSGTILSSRDGVTWEKIDVGVTNRFEKVIWTGSRFIVIGSGGVVLSSNTAFSWTRHQSGMTTNLLGIASYGVLFMMVGVDGFSLSSTNLQFWQSRQTYTSSWLFDVSAFGDQYFAVGYNGTIIVANRGSVWHPRNSGTNRHLIASAVSDTLAYAVGYYGTILTSPNLYDWHQQNAGTAHHLGGIAYGNGDLIVLGEQGTILVSEDGGLHWQHRESPSVESLHDAAWNGEFWVAVGDHGTILVSY